MRPPFLPTTLAAAVVIILCGCSETMYQSESPVKQPVAGKLVLRGVTVVDTRNGSLTPNMNIVAEAGKIISIAPTGGMAVDASFESIDATGKFVVPGYLDMHAHVLGHPDNPTGNLALMLANGITGYRQMHGSPALLAARRAGTLPLTLDAPVLLASPGQLLTPFNARNQEVAIETVREQKAQGADFIKIGLVSPDVALAVFAEGKRLGIPIAGHVPSDLDVVEASKAGMKSIEHLGPGNGILVACSSDPVALRKLAPKMPAFLKALPFKIPYADQIVTRLLKNVVVNPAAATGPEEIAFIRQTNETFDEEKCKHVVAEFVKNGTWQVPTLIRIRSSQLAFEPEFQSDPNLSYVSKDSVESWKSITNKFSEKLTAESKEMLRKTYLLDLMLVKLLDSAGVKMMTGSDVTGAGWLVPGFSLHQEFDELAKSGLPPLRILQMTTINPAEFLGRMSTMGTVEPGKEANLVLLDANPIESVLHLHKIFAVVRGGFYRSKRDLDVLKSKVLADPPVN